MNFLNPYFKICCICTLAIGLSMNAYGQKNRIGKGFRANLNCTVDLILYNGLYDWETNTSYSGGNPTEDNITFGFNSGAYTLTNWNDTDGDGTYDDEDDEVVASNFGRNEVDLIRLDMVGLEADLEGTVNLRILSGDVAFWENPTKSGPIPIINRVLSFPASELNKTIYVEVTRPSFRARDIVFELEHNGYRDVAKATGIWVDIARTFETRQAADGFPNNPSVGVGNDIPFLDEEDTVDYIEDEARSEDGSRYGIGTFQQDSQTGQDELIGGRRLQEYEIRPSNLSLVDGVRFNVAEQNSLRQYTMFYGSKELTEGSSLDFPGEEYPTGIGSAGLLDMDINEGRIYNFHSKSIDRETPGNSNYIGFLNVRDFVRIQFETFDNDGTIEGSRASDYLLWHCSKYFKKDILNKYILDNDPISVSGPAFTGDGLGDAYVTLYPGAFTEAYSLLFNAANQEWYLYDSEGYLAYADDPEGDFVWKFDLPSVLEITIEGSMPSGFSHGDAFEFNVFETQNPNGKTNIIQGGNINVTVDP